MAFVELRRTPDTSATVAHLIEHVIEKHLREFHHLLTFRPSNHSPTESMQLTCAVVLLVITDGAAQLLYPMKGGAGDRFKGFLRTHYPWSADPPDGLTVEEALDILWDQMRCPLIHRAGVRYDPSLPPRHPIIFGTLRALDEARLEDLEGDAHRPPLDPQFGGRQIVLGSK